MGEQKLFRCAVYTRKSSEEGLEQDFNSLEAQREACEAYVRSQSHEGWKLIPERFDDGGFSGGNMDRPAVKRLMAMVSAGQIDVIVIYKIDRLTRSLTDFARLAEVLDRHGVSFVSVTQQFNTTTSMGRLMLNVLLSFAQFEREITGERIRDKIAASKQKGMWMGGNVPMGYDVKDRRLLINETDAATVRTIFASYLEVGTVPALLDRLQQAGIGTSPRVSAKGRPSGGRPFARGHLYKLLSNPIYIGRVPHKTISHPGQHEPIIDRAVWDQVQAQLAANTQGTRVRRRRAVTEGGLLAGLLYTEAGNRMIPAHATKGSRRYRYYVEERVRGDGENKSSVPAIRLPATEIEEAALTALQLVLADKRQLLHHLDVAADQINWALNATASIVETLRNTSDHRRTVLLRAMLEKVVYRRDSLALHVAVAGLRTAIGMSKLSSEWSDNAAGEAASFVTTAPLIYRRRGVQAKLTIADASTPERLDTSLVATLARARDWADRLLTGEADTMSEIATADGVSMQYVARLVPLAFLAPRLVDEIVEGRQSPDLTSNRLALLNDLPITWQAQEHYLSGSASSRS